MAVTFVAASVTVAGAASAKSVARPAGATTGDLLIANVVVFPAAATIAAPGGVGWNTLLAKTSNTLGDFSGALFYRWDDGTAGPWSFDTTGATSWADAECVAYRGLLGSGSPIDVVQATDNENNDVGGTYTGVTTTRANDLVLFYLLAGSSRTLSAAPTGFTTRLNPPTSSAANYVGDILSQASAGATGNVSVAWTGNQYSIGVVAALFTQAAAGGGGAGGSRLLTGVGS